MPAASSSTRRRCSGLAWMISPMRPWCTSAGRARAGRGVGEQDLHVAGAHLAAVDAIGGARSRSIRRETSSVSCSLNWAGALRSLLSICIATSALLRAGRLLVPAKITSSMSAARSDLCEVSPITQRSASTRFDLPQPFGPTTPVSPGSIRKSVGSTKDLKPSRRSRVSFMPTLFQYWRPRPDGIVAGLGPMEWVERGKDGRRIDRKNELPGAIPQQKEDVVPSLVMGRRAAGRPRSRGPLHQAKKWLKNPYQPLR